MNILVVEDDVNLNKIICTYLAKNDYNVVASQNPIEAYQELSKSTFDLIISDVMMPKIDGFEFVESIRNDNSSVPILFITALDDFNSKRKGFNAGIDDYMVKPLDMDELVLRVGALVRRGKLRADNKLQIGNIVLLRDEMTVFADGNKMNITPKEFGILYKMLCSPEKVFTRSALSDDYWGLNNEASLRSIDVYITKIRKEFANYDCFEIVTVHGFGYKVVLKC